MALDITIQVNRKIGLAIIPNGSAVAIEATFRDNVLNPPTLVNPATYTITITNPSGTATVTAASLTNVSTGVYKYNYTTTSATGAWTVAITGIYNSLTSVQSCTGFITE